MPRIEYYREGQGPGMILGASSEDYVNLVQDLAVTIVRYIP